MRKYIFVLSVFISLSAFLFAQTEDHAVNTESLFVSPTDPQAFKNAKKLARKKAKSTRKAFRECLYGNLRDTRLYTANIYNDDPYQETPNQFLDERREATCLQMYNYEDLIDDHDNNMADLLQTYNIDPGYISRNYSNEAEITDKEEIEYLLKNIKSENGRFKLLEKYIGYDIECIYFVIYKYFGKGSHVKAFLFTPEGVILERLYFTDTHNHVEKAVNFKTNESVYITEEEAWIFTQG